MNEIEFIIDVSTNLLIRGGILYGFLLVLLECFIPILPLSIIVALNINSFGFVKGFILSWIATTLGNTICFELIKHLLPEKRNHIKERNIIVLMSIPFIPSICMNTLSGITRLPRKKYIVFLLIGKFFVILYWSYIGKCFIESILNIKSLLYISIVILLTYSISRIIYNKWKIE